MMDGGRTAEMSRPEIKAIALLGAEKQAATSFALAWPQRRFIFVSDQRVIDGWDLPNLDFLAAGPPDLPRLRQEMDCGFLPLCARWLDRQTEWPGNLLGSFALSRVLPWLAGRFPGLVLPVWPRPPAGEPWLAKGDLGHRPDAVLAGASRADLPPPQANGMGLVFQPYLEGATTYLVIGGRADDGSMGLAVLLVHQEAFGREDFLLAAESVADPGLIERSLALLKALDHRGLFTLNWLRLGEQVVLSSLRPLPRAAMGLLRRGGVDCLDLAGSGLQVAPAGLRLSAEYHYCSYQELG